VTEEPPTIPHGRGHNPAFVTFDDPLMFRPRLLSDHIVEAQDAALNIQVLDQPGHGNAHHVYQFYVEPNANNERGYKATIHFQNGPIVEHGINGITQEALLAVVADRLRSFQAGRFACRENGEALTHVEEAIHWLQQRTIQRRRRGVEGLSIV
jgi:hypothetical protein